jgi:GntR family transcriptional repressor for pyruvate dehydrogenase complex
MLSDRRSTTGRLEVEPRKRYEAIAEQLLVQISERHLLPGDALPSERELTERYGAGRSSVREALRMLESRGVIAPNGTGSFVVAAYANPLNTSLQLLLHLDQATLHDIYELRRILECEAAAIAAERRNEAQLASMDDAIDTMARALAGAAADRRALYIDGDVRFHLAIAEATRNGVIIHTMRALRDLLRRALMSIFLIPGSPEHSLEQHRSIRAAIADREPTRARERMRAHLERVEADMNRAVSAGVVRAVVDAPDG